MDKMSYRTILDRIASKIGNIHILYTLYPNIT